MAIDPTTRKLVEAWISHQGRSTPLLPSIIAHEVATPRKLVDPLAVAEVLVILSMQGRIRPAFAVRLPGGPILRRVYHSLNEIEPELSDQVHPPVSRDDVEVLQAFERVDE